MKNSESKIGQVRQEEYSGYHVKMICGTFSSERYYGDKGMKTLFKVAAEIKERTEQI